MIKGNPQSCLPLLRQEIQDEVFELHIQEDEPQREKTKKGNHQKGAGTGSVNSGKPCA